MQVDFDAENYNGYHFFYQIYNLNHSKHLLTNATYKKEIFYIQQHYPATRTDTVQISQIN